MQCWPRRFLILYLLCAVAVSGAEIQGSRAGAKHTSPTKNGFPLSVLLITPPFAGHLTPCLALGEELVKRGHNVTLVSAPTEFIKNETEKRRMSFWSIGPGFINADKHRELFQNREGDTYITGVISTEVSVDFQKRVIKTIDNAAIRSFDIIVGDKDFFTSLMCVSRKWKKRSIYLSPSLSTNPFDLHPWPFPTTNSGYTDNLDFCQRLVLTIKRKALQTFIKGLAVFYSLSTGGICKKVNTSLGDLAYYSHFHPMIITSSFRFQFPHALLPFTHYVGPLISPSQPNLPQNIGDWLDERGPKSVVYVSMGTTAILTSAQAEMIINGATQANFSVVWSLRKTNQHILEHMTYDYDKVMIADWIPQVAIFRHPSIHSAVLHGGLGGIQEALSQGIPLLVIPFLFDQLDNAVRVKYYHYGEMIHLHEISTPLVNQTLRMIGSELYRTSLQTIRKIYKKDGGASKATDLVEFYSDVGYDHLVPSYAKYNWNWVQYYNVDVISTLSGAVLLLSYVLYRSIRCCCTFTCMRHLKSRGKID